MFVTSPKAYLILFPISYCLRYDVFKRCRHQSFGLSAILIRDRVYIGSDQVSRDINNQWAFVLLEPKDYFQYKNM